MNHRFHRHLRRRSAGENQWNLCNLWLKMSPYELNGRLVSVWRLVMISGVVYAVCSLVIKKRRLQHGEKG